MKCPYNDFNCNLINTSGMSKTTECYECEHYNLGVRATGATPILAKVIDSIHKIIFKENV